MNNIEINKFQYYGIWNRAEIEPLLQWCEGSRAASAPPLLLNTNTYNVPSATRYQPLPVVIVPRFFLRPTLPWTFC